MRKTILTFVLLATTVAVPGGALAQSAIEGRVDRLEREMRAVQRKVEELVGVDAGFLNPRLMDLGDAIDAVMSEGTEDAVYGV